MLLAGGPGDSSVDEVLSLARQGGAAWLALMGGDVVGIDQRGTGASRPSLASNVRYNLPLDRPGSPEAWLPLIREASSREATGLKAESHEPWRIDGPGLDTLCRGCSFRDERGLGFADAATLRMFANSN
jgi:hypothetical protein